MTSVNAIQHKRGTQTLSGAKVSVTLSPDGKEWSLRELRVKFPAAYSGTVSYKVDKATGNGGPDYDFTETSSSLSSVTSWSAKGELVYGEEGDTLVVTSSADVTGDVFVEGVFELALNKSVA